MNPAFKSTNRAAVNAMISATGSETVLYKGVETPMVVEQTAGTVVVEGGRSTARNEYTLTMLREDALPIPKSNDRFEVRGQRCRVIEVDTQTPAAWVVTVGSV